MTKKAVTARELQKLLNQHRKWMNLGGPEAKFGAAGSFRGAVLNDAYLRGADLSGLDLRAASLSGADLRGANLRGADLSGAFIRSARLDGAYLEEAKLVDAKLTDSNCYATDFKKASLDYASLDRTNCKLATFAHASLAYAKLRGTDLKDANFYGANLSHVDLSGARLTGAGLGEVLNLDLKEVIRGRNIVPETGAFEAYKKVRDGDVLRLLIPADAVRVGGVLGRKCRASKAEVLGLAWSREGRASEKVWYSKHDGNFTYKRGQILTVNDFDPSPLIECTRGIHFFMTLQEAIEY